MKTEQTITQSQLREICFTLLVNDHHGSYMGQCLATSFGDALSLPEGCLDILTAGPDHAEYCEACEEIYSGTIVDGHGKSFDLSFMDGGIFAIDQELIAAWENETGSIFDWE